MITCIFYGDTTKYPKWCNFNISIFKTMLEREQNFCLALIDSKLLAKLFKFSGKSILPMKVKFKTTFNLRF